jgi:superfamily II DNA or RNA helicase/HKD family nuclease
VTSGGQGETVEPGLRDHLITERDRAELASIESSRLEIGDLPRTDAPRRLGYYLKAVAERLLAGKLDDEATEVDSLAATVNGLITSLADGTPLPEDQLTLPPEVLQGIRAQPSGRLAAAPQLPPRPTIPLTTSDLLYNGRGQPTLGAELQLEIESADRIDLICAFVIWTGVRILLEPLRRLVERGGQLRVITTTYMGVTEPRAVNALTDLGADVRIAFDAPTTKLHAKAWLLERAAGLSTAFVGSSNLSRSALHDGLEWNVRLANADAGHVIESVRRTFLSHWESDLFEAYDPERDVERLRGSLKAHQKGGHGRIVFAGLDVHPLRHQQWMLDDLTRERERHDRHRNLIVAATGTGKTVVAALDYRRLREQAGRDLSLLFVAHRRRILDQSQATFQAVMRDGNFGEFWGGGERPVAGRHVFAMIQSLDSETVAAIPADAYDVVIVDEFHHAAAPSYRALLESLRPTELLGLTATPERLDGEDVTTWFDGRIAHELRLWDAIEQGFLAPFQYFGVADGTDLSTLEWRRGAYRTRDLEERFVHDDELANRRTAKLLDAIQSLVLDPGTMRALGFCVSVEHAKYMAARFTAAGVPSLAISGETPDDQRDAALRQLTSGDLRVVFSVDVLGEGVDAPAVDTLLMLRPTQSPTVFAQQLGRGLRLAPNKRCLTVIDLIGQQHRSFRFDRRYRALLDARHGSVSVQLEDGFPFLPSGCHIELDRVSRDIVLANLKQVAVLGQWRTLVDDLSGMGDANLARFLRDTDRIPEDLYRDRNRNWTRLRRDAGLATHGPGSAELEPVVLGAMHRLLHVDDPERVEYYSGLLGRPAPPSLSSLSARHRRLLSMLYFSLFGTQRRFDSLEDGLAELWRQEAARAELLELLAVLDERSETIGRPLGLGRDVPVATHARYALVEILAAFDIGSVARPPQVREGVKWVEDASTDLLFVTLNKSEQDYSPTTMYRDYAISPTLFHWESQSTTAEHSATAQRYIHHRRRGSNVVIFVRDRAKLPNGATSPYVCLGRANYVSHQGSRPLAVTWELEHAMPESLFSMARAVAAA